ncbi:polymeric immunoglobulin receptor-like [Varanus komodoensis]|uniref:polymeric immunoglobulin receptor-like n=1 Tax=Varanus komodoensis TaxID=61221 RepID=UPI001CF7963A|nr:polymeric immunoglobulin receptor-like [Varanus komodoensis]
MRISYSLIWTLFQVCCALEGPNAVTAPLGGPVTLLCKYGKGDEKLVKFWCKETNRRICSSDRIVRTTGSEAEVKWKRMSIKDNHLFHEFLVTMENLTQEDAGTYLCGVERSYDIWHKVEVNILSDAGGSTHFRSTEQATEEPGGASNVPESIQPSKNDFLLLLKIPIFIAMLVALVWVHMCYRKGRCSTRSPETQEELQAVPSKDVVTTTALEKREEVSYATLAFSDQREQAIYDNVAPHGHALPQPRTQEDDHTHFQFTVRMEDLTEQDAGGYWCAIERSGKDHGTLVTITVLPGSWTLTGPRKMDSSVGGSLSVICNYTKGYEKNAKFWCKVEPGFFLDSCPVLIESGSKDETRQGNIYIKDNKEKHYFEVTMDNLRMEDSGIYKCGIHRTVFIDIKHRVTVNVMFTVPEERLPNTKPEERLPTTKPEERLPTTKPEERLPTTKQEERVSATKHPESDPPIKGTVKSNPGPAHTGPRNSQLYILIYSSIPLLALLLTIVVVAVVSRCKRTGSCLVRKKERQVSNMALEKREEVSYATLAFSDQREQAIYDNVAPHGHALPQPRTQEVIYTEVAK